MDRLVSEQEIKERLEDILKNSDLSSKSFNEIRRDLETSFGLSVGSMKTKKSYIIELIQTFQSSYTNPYIETNGANFTVDEDTLAYKQLTKFAAAACKGPVIYKDLTNLDIPAKCDTLRRRLRNAGFVFKGSAPSDREIKRVRRMQERARELEGLDTSLIMSDCRRRGSLQEIRPVPEIDLLDNCGSGSEAEFDPSVKGAKQDTHADKENLGGVNKGNKRPLEHNAEDEEEAELCF